MQCPYSTKGFYHASIIISLK